MPAGSDTAIVSRETALLSRRFGDPCDRFLAGRRRRGKEPLGHHPWPNPQSYPQQYSPGYPPTRPPGIQPCSSGLLSRRRQETAVLRSTPPSRDRHDSLTCKHRVQGAGHSVRYEPGRLPCDCNDPQPTFLPGTSMQPPGVPLYRCRASRFGASWGTAVPGAGETGGFPGSMSVPAISTLTPTAVPPC